MWRSDDVETEGKGDRDGDGVTDRDGEAPGLVNRRSALKAGAVALTGAVAAGGAIGASDYDTVTVPGGTIRRIDLGTDDALRNVVFDVSAPGAGVKIVPSGTGWVVENVGIEGRFDAETFLVLPHVDEGGRGVIRNVYAKSYGTNGGGVWVQPSHAGELVIENVWLEGFPNNGVYGSAPGKRAGGGKGRVVVRDSVGCNNNVSQFRTGSPNCVVENCAMWYDRTPEDYPLTGAGVTVRGVWVRGYDCTVRDCDIEIPGSMDGAGASVLAVENSDQFPGSTRTYADLQNTRVDGFVKGDVVGGSAGDAAKRVPVGVPRSPEEAASGGGAGSTDGDTGDTTPTWHSLHVGGNGDRVTYEFAVTGNLEATETVDPHETVDGSSARGVVIGADDDFRFTGELASFEADGDIVVTVDGDPVDYTRTDSTAGPSRTLEISGGSATDVVGYEFSVDGELEGEAIDPEDSVEGSTGSGAVAGGVDTYRFSGSVTGFSSDGDLAVAVDGREVDPAQWGDTTDGSDDSTDGSDDTTDGSDGTLPNSLVIDGTGTDGTSTYAFTVSGDVAKDPDRGSVDDEDVISGSDVEGAVAGGVDAYRFSGDVTAFRLRGGAVVRFEDNDG